ncbi:MAG: HNH endonuclease [Chloroflexi bacterium]|nr:HNH endonuclease [Chloroflexota bacterium]MBI3763767.1 HNH endonuclease [Chloroflexota bacterium]
MAGVDIPGDLRDFVRERAKGRCEYCLTSEELSGIRCEIDHIVPRSRGGATIADNLCLACGACNGHKHARTHAIDPESGAQVLLFNPREQRWNDHCAWNADHTEITGLTPTGRATVTALQMNDPLIVGARSLWVSISAHPPLDD